MSSPRTRHPLPQPDREKRWVALSSVLAAVLLVATKLVVGIWTNSLGILSEAAHSGLDLVAAAVTLWAVRISAQPADREHTYGHGKFENLSALVETLLLLLTCVWIIQEAVARLFFLEGVKVNPSVWAFLVVIMSIVVDVSRSRALRRVAVKYGSQALEADALHFSTDIWSSLVVLVGLLAVLAADVFQLPWLLKADALAALGVAVIVILVGVQLGKRSIDVLLDTIPKGLQEKIAAAAGSVAGVEQVTQVRLRRSGSGFFADVAVSVGRAAAFEQAHQIADQAEAAVRGVLPEADVVVHVEPVARDEENLTTTIRVLAARHHLGAHGIRIYEEAAERSLELHLEVSESLDLEQAHRQATEFERDLRQSVPGLKRIVTHLEPAGDDAATLRAEPAGQVPIRRVLEEFLEAYPLRARPHDMRVQMAGGELAVSFHCTLDAATAITEAHDFTVRLEEYLRGRVPNLGRVVIHVEPAP
jgi:cation diffusion facilitator family transporter